MVRHESGEAGGSSGIEAFTAHPYGGQQPPVRLRPHSGESHSRRSLGEALARVLRPMHVFLRSRELAVTERGHDLCRLGAVHRHVRRKAMAKPVKSDLSGQSRFGSNHPPRLCQGERACPCGWRENKVARLALPAVG